MSSIDRAASFSLAVEAVLISARPGFAKYPPEILVASWKAFVLSCEDGYPDYEEEFANDRDVRSAIEIVLGHDEFKAYPEWEHWAREIAELDARYRAIVVPIPWHSGPWWESVIPRIAGRRLAGDVLRMYGLRLEER